MIGPPGYGDARFISTKTPLNYKIRFENDPNATAPAQHVIILHTLDQDLDIRTFRVTGFGFGSFNKKLTNLRASLQVTELSKTSQITPLLHEKILKFDCFLVIFVSILEESKVFMSQMSHES